MLNHAIRAVKEDDIDAIVDIYNYYIINSVATFETEVVTYQEMQTRILKVQENNFPWLVIEDTQGEIMAMRTHVNGVKGLLIDFLLK